MAGIAFAEDVVRLLAPRRHPTFLLTDPRYRAFFARRVNFLGVLSLTGVAAATVLVARSLWRLQFSLSNGGASCTGD